MVLLLPSQLSLNLTVVDILYDYFYFNRNSPSSRCCWSSFPHQKLQRFCAATFGWSCWKTKAGTRLFRSHNRFSRSTGSSAVPCTALWNRSGNWFRCTSTPAYWLLRNGFLPICFLFLLHDLNELKIELIGCKEINGNCKVLYWNWRTFRCVKLIKEFFL